MSDFEPMLEALRASYGELDQPYEVGAASFCDVLAKQKQLVEQTRREWEQDFVMPYLKEYVKTYVDILAARAARPAIGKPLSRRARRRNRGRVRAEKVALSRLYRAPVR